MRKIHENILKACELAWLYLPSAYGSFKNRKLFEGIETYCMFIGYPKSGKSLIAALLDAHPNIIIADELGVLKYIRSRFSKRQIFYLLLKRSQIFAKTGLKRGGYSYIVPNQWQGQFKKLLIIGDNKGCGATLRLQAMPCLLKNMKKVVNLEIKFIHVVRNPYDNITTIFMRKKIVKNDLRECIKFYFSLCEMVSHIKQQIKEDDLFELRHESFIENPKTYLKKLCHFLGIDAPNDYVSDCTNIVFKPPHKSRYDVQWDQELIDIVNKRIKEFPFLIGYSYEN